jgi:D-aspartate ligase
MSGPPVVLLPCDRPAALGIARSLGRRGIPVYGVDTDRWAMGMLSRYLRPLPMPRTLVSEEDRAQFLLELGERLQQRAVLFPLSDDAVIMCSRYRTQLGRYFLYVMPDHDTVAGLLTKDGLHRTAGICGVPAPRAFFPETGVEVEALASGLPYPVILKPLFSPEWLDPGIIAMLRDDPLSGPPKVALCSTPEDLIRNYSRVAAFGSRTMIQEVIPGKDSNLSYFCFYMDRKSRPLAVFSGRKLRILPVGFGSASFVRSSKDPELEEVSLRLLEGTRYQGLGGIEFKRDPRDDRFKLIEFNVRFGMWDALGARCGVDIPYTAYCDALDIPVKPRLDFRENVAWIDLQRDIRAFLIYRRRGEIDLKTWLTSLRGEREGSAFSFDDMTPAAAAAMKLLERPWKKIKERLC